MDDHFKKLFLKNYRNEEEKERQEANTDEIAMWFMNNPEKFAPVMQWHTNFYFHGLDEFSVTCLFEQDIIRTARVGITKPLFIDATAKGGVVNYSLYGVMAAYFKEPYDFDAEELDRVKAILEDIRIKDDVFIWKQVDWDYFIEKHWFVVVSEVFESQVKDLDTLKNSFIVKQINKALEGSGLVCEWIDKDDNFDPPHSGMGIDFSKCFPKQSILKLDDKDLK